MPHGCGLINVTDKVLLKTLGQRSSVAPFSDQKKILNQILEFSVKKEKVFVRSACVLCLLHCDTSATQDRHEEADRHVICCGGLLGLQAIITSDDTQVGLLRKHTQFHVLSFMEIRFLGIRDNFLLILCLKRCQH